MKMKTIITFILFLSMGNVFSQGFQFAGLEYSYFPQVEQNIGEQKIKASFQEFGVLFKMPLKSKDEKTIFINSLRYDLLQATLVDTPFFTESKTQKNLHKLAYALMVVRRLKNDWIVLIRAKPTLVSDLNHKLDIKDFIFQGTVLVSKKLNDNLKLGAGLVYTTQTGEPLLLPAIQLDYQKNRHSLNMILPSHILYMYKIDKNGKFKIGLKSKFSGGNFAVDFSAIDKGISKSIDRVIYSRGNLGILFNTKLSDMMALELLGGISGLRKYRFEDSEEAMTSFDPRTGAFFTIGLNFNLNKK